MILVSFFYFFSTFNSLSKSYDAVLKASPAPNPKPNVVNATLLPVPERNNTTDANPKPTV